VSNHLVAAVGIHRTEEPFLDIGHDEHGLSHDEPPLRCRNAGHCLTPSSAPAAVEPTVLEGLGAVLGIDGRGPGEIRDRARDLQRAVVTARGQPQSRHGRREQAVTLRGNGADTAKLAGRQLGIEARRAHSKPIPLSVSCKRDTRADGRRVVARATLCELSAVDRRQLDL
jgi:hypothetical protein